MAYVFGEEGQEGQSVQHGLVDAINLCKGLYPIDDASLQQHHYFPLCQLHLLHEAEGHTDGRTRLRFRDCLNADLLAVSELEEDEPVAGHCHFEVALEPAVHQLHLHLEARLAEQLLPAEETQDVGCDLLLFLLLLEGEIGRERVLVEEGEGGELEGVAVLLRWLFLHLQPNLLSN